MRRMSINWEGELMPSPHGDLVEYREAFKLEEENERLRKALEEVDRLAAERMKAIESQAGPAPAGVRLFGWINPDAARQFNSGKTSYCKVFKKRTPVFCMPIMNALGPNHYQKPPIGETVKIHDGLSVEVTGHVPEGLTVAAGGIEFNVDKWSWNPCKTQ